MPTLLQTRARDLAPGLVPSVARSVWPVVAIVALAIVLQLFVKPWVGGVEGGDFYNKLAVDILVNVMLAVSLTMVNGFTGQFSIGHAAFMAVGAYTAAGIMYYASFRLYGSPDVHGGRLSTMLTGVEGPLVTGADLLFFGALLAGGLVAALFGYLVGLPSLRLRGDYLAIVTLGFGEIVRVLIQSQTRDVLYDADEIRAAPVVGIVQLFAAEKSLGEVGWSAWWDQMQGPLWTKLGGALGFSGLPFYTSYFWVALMCGVTLLVAIRMKYSSAGRALLSIREDEIAAEAMGVDTTKYKIRAFVISAFFAGIAGGLFAHTVGVQLNAGELGFVKSFEVIIMVVLGGLGSISGGAIAAAILTVLPEALRDFELSVSQALLGVFVLVAVVGGVRAAWGLVRGRGVSPRAKRLLIIGTGVSVAVFVASFVAPAFFGTRFNLGDYRMILYALALILMMIARPKGLLGVREIWEIWRRH